MTSDVTNGASSEEEDFLARRSGSDSLEDVVFEESSFPFVELRMEKALHVVRTATVKTRWDLTRRSYFHRYSIRLLRNSPSTVYWPGSFPAPKQLEKPVCAILLGLCWITDSELLKIAPGREDAARWNGNR